MQIGQDFVLLKKVELPSGAYSRGRVAIPSLILPRDLSLFHISTRSRLALTAVEVISDGWDTKQNLSMNGYVETTLAFKNNGKRHIVLNEGEMVGRPYIEGTNIEGKELAKLLKEKVHIDGLHRIIINEEQEPAGVRLDLDSESRREIPQGEPVVPNGEVNSRELSDRLARPIEPSVDEICWFAETYAHVGIYYGIVGVLQDPASPRVRMLNSRLIYGGQTDWPIRAEFVSPTVPREMPTYVDMVFQKAA